MGALSPARIWTYSSVAPPRRLFSYFSLATVDVPLPHPMISSPLHHSTVVPTLSPVADTGPLASISGVPPGTAMRALSLPTHHFVTTHNVSGHPMHRFRHRIRFMPKWMVALPAPISHPILSPSYRVDAATDLYRQRAPFSIPAQSRPRETPMVGLLISPTLVPPRASVMVHPENAVCRWTCIRDAHISNLRTNLDLDLDLDEPKSQGLPRSQSLTRFRWGHILALSGEYTFWRRVSMRR
ncbi:hypothetical protein C8F01DRAFT_1255460 [Mycena amicta]|nr:hypothetical protein C8F01DRAFT_1255460 [Mycena amicta]